METIAAKSIEGKKRLYRKNENNNNLSNSNFRFSMKYNLSNQYSNRQNNFVENK